MKNYAILTWNVIKSRVVRPIIYFICSILILIFLFDSFLMPWFVNRGGTQQVPNVVGLKKEVAMQLLDSIHLEPREGEIRADNSYPEGFVVGQNPLSDQIVKSGRRIYLTISGGELPAIVPVLRGRSLRDAKFALDRSGLRQGSISYNVSIEFPEGTIITQDIAAGTKIKRNSFVSITVSAGESIDSIIVPSLIGKTLAEVQKILKGKGLNVGNITYQVQQELLPNTVIDQFPRENQVVTFEKSIDLFIAQAPDRNRPIREN
jgi:eukaryotic-like serine/threonine-protein kinase